jgi:hypothetical protein
MAEGYICDETVGFVIEYMVEFKHVRSRVRDVDEKKRVCGEVLKGARTKFILNPKTCDLAHQYVFTNVVCLTPWVRYVIMIRLG